MADALCITRSPHFAPGMGYAHDLQLMQAVAERLGADIIGEDDLVDAGGYATVLTMARGERALEVIGQCEGRVINSVQSIRNCTRTRCIAMMNDAGVPMPTTVCVQAGERIESLTAILPCWTKRGDACTQERNEIRFCRTDEELAAALDNLRNAGAREVVLSAHAEGRLIKFYGITGTGFFKAYEGGEPMSVSGLEEVARRAADALALTVWGGDAIISPDGQPLIIDLNDWPSFTPCREEAADIIASLTGVARTHAANNN